MSVYGWVAFAILGTGLALLLLGGGGDGTIMGVPPEQLAGITAGLALLVYLGSGLIGPEQKIAPLIKSLVIWAVLLAAVALGYGLYLRFLG